MKTKINYLIWLSLALTILPAISSSNSRPNQMVWNKDGAEMAYIPAGSFEMGDAMNETEVWMERSRPVHTITLDGFYIDKTEVTVGQFKAFLADSGYNWTGSWDDVDQYSPGDDYPMIYVDWNDATAYAKWSGKRLPTEAEWEYAARGGLVGKRYSWGSGKADGSQGNFADKSSAVDWANANVDDGYATCSPVGSYPPNSYGLYDMGGNVWEWCSDWYSSYSKSPGKNPPGPDSGSSRVVVRATILITCGWLTGATTFRIIGSTEADFDVCLICLKSSLPYEIFLSSICLRLNNRILHVI